MLFKAIFEARDTMRNHGVWVAYAEQRETLGHSRSRSLWIIWLAFSMSRHHEQVRGWRA